MNPKMLNRKIETVKYLSQSETEKFFSAVKKHPRDHLLFRLMYLYGMRVSEVVSLRLSDIQPDHNPREIHIRRLKGGVSRHYPLRSDITILLKKWLRIRGKMKNSDGNVWLFPTSHSSLFHMSPVNVSKLMEKYGEKIGLSRALCHPHSLRHSCGVHLLQNGCDILDVQNHLGHTSIGTTVAYYSRFGHKDWVKKSNYNLENRLYI